MKVSVRAGLAAALLAIVAAVPARGDAGALTDLGFENLAALQVSSASRFLQTAREAPSAVEVVGREEIRRHGWTSLAQVVGAFTGTYATTDRAYDFVGTRGFLVPGDYNTRFLLLVDGQRANDNVYEQAPFGEEFPLDLSLIERVEYVPGPGSALYGSNAIFGVINVITRRAGEMPPAAVALRGSDDGWAEAVASLARTTQGGAGVVLSATVGRRGGNDQAYGDPQGNLFVAGGGVSPDGVAHDLDRQHRRQFYGRFGDDGLSLAIRHGARVVRPSSALYGTLFDDASLRIEDRLTQVLGRHQGRVSEALEYEVRVEYNEVTYAADYPYDDGLGGRYLNRDETRGRWWGGDLRLLHAGIAGHRIVAGVEAQADVENRQRNFDVGASINAPIDATGKRRRSGLYVLDEWAFAERWRASLGLRHDRFSTVGDRTSPRLGLIWLASEQTSLKLLAGTAYRVPNAYETDYSNGVNYLGNGALRPETIRTVELVAERRFGGGSSLRASLFDYRLVDLIAQVDAGGGVLQYRNRPSVHATGAELAWRAAWESGARFDASLAVNRARDADGNRPGFSPDWIAKLRGALPLPGDRLLVAADAHATAATRYDYDGLPRRLPARVLVDLSLTTVRSGPGLGGLLRVRNAFDRRYALPASAEVPVPEVPERGRTIEATVRYAF